MNNCDEDDFLTDSPPEERVLEGNQRGAAALKVDNRRKKNDEVSDWILQDLIRKMEPRIAAAKNGRRDEDRGNQKIAKSKKSISRTPKFVIKRESIQNF